MKTLTILTLVLATACSPSRDEVSEVKPTGSLTLDIEVVDDRGQPSDQKGEIKKKLSVTIFDQSGDTVLQSPLARVPQDILLEVGQYHVVVESESASNSIRYYAKTNPFRIETGRKQSIALAFDEPTTPPFSSFSSSFFFSDEAIGKTELSEDNIF